MTAVMGFHAHMPFLVGGGIGVMLFFTLSGFLITALLLDEYQRNGGVSLASFYARRAIRLLPALAVMLVAETWFTVRFQVPAISDRTIHALPAVIFYVANWRMVLLGSYELGSLVHTWSLGVEEQFYLLWPVILLVALGRGQRLGLALVVAVAGCVLALLLRLLLWHGLSSTTRMFGSDTMADQLLFGCALALILRRTPAAEWAFRWGRPLTIAALLAAVVLTVFVVSVSTVADDPGRTHFVYTFGLAGVAACSAVVIAHVIVSPQALLPRLLAWAPITMLGRISYGVYLWHYPVFLALTDRFGVSWHRVWVLGFVLTIVIAAVSYIALERPLLQGLKVRFER